MKVILCVLAILGINGVEKRGIREKNTAYNQQRGHLLRLPSEGVNDGHHIIEHLILTRGEMEYTEEENSTPKPIQQHKVIQPSFSRTANQKIRLSALLEMMV